MMATLALGMAVAIGPLRVFSVGSPFGPRPGDPALVAGDPRLTACPIPPDQVWLAFPMLRASDFSLHFPGWSDGAPELAIADPALVVMSSGTDVGTTGSDPQSPRPLYYQLCIVVGQPGEAIVHRYGWTRFDAVRPSLDGPLVPLP